MRHEASLEVLAEDGRPVRAHLEAAAARGHAPAIERLEEGPAVPAPLVYLREWALELHAQRQWHMGGPQPVTYQDVEAWARLTDRHVRPHEVQALITLTTVLAHPERKESDRGR